MALKESKRILIRVDASPRIGAGHMMRMVALGQLLSDDGYEVHFATIANEDFYLNYLKKQGFVIHALIEENPWAELADLTHFLKLAASIKPAWVVLDGYQFTSSYELALKQAGYKLLRIDDVPQGHYFADVILNQNFGAENFVYEKESYTKVLAGLQVVLLRREFRNFDPLKKIVKKNGPLQIMVSLGGSCQATDVVYQIIAEALAGLPEVAVKKIVGQDNMAEEMDSSDLAIVSGGSTMWELVYMSVPFFAVALNKKQEDYLAVLAQQGMCINLGLSEKLTVGRVRQTVFDLIRNQAVLVKMKARYQESIDRSAIGQEILDTLALAG